MRKLIPLLMLIFTSQSFAQSVVIEELNTMTGDISGTELDYNTAISVGTYGDAEFKITNDSDSLFLMGFHVDLLTSGANWGNHALVWAHEDDQFGGLGFAGAYVDNGFSFPTSEYIQLLPGESAFLNPSWYVEDDGCETYRYYITNEGVIFDSLQVNYCNSTLGINELKEQVVQVYPCPVDDVLYFNVDVVGAKEFQIVNVIGELMFKVQKTFDSNSVNVEGFNNGIYFFSVRDHEGVKITRKFIILH